MASSNLSENITAIKQMSRVLQTWTGGGNTFTVVDPHVRADSLFLSFPTTAIAGRWYVSSITAGTSFVITSSNAEVTNPSFYYVLL